MRASLLASAIASTPDSAPPSASHSIVRSCARYDGAKAAIFCAPICACRHRPSCGSSTSSSSKSKAAYKNLKDDLQLRPIYHQLQNRIEAHIFVAFLAYCLHVMLHARLEPLALGLSPYRTTGRPIPSRRMAEIALVNSSARIRPQRIILCHLMSPSGAPSSCRRPLT